MSDLTNPLSVGCDPSLADLIELVADKVLLAASNAPGSATSSGTAGMIRFDEDYVYICVDEDTWKRTALTSW